jgi:hypothetical protein
MHWRCAPPISDRFDQLKKNKMNCELMLTYDAPALRQTGSRNLTCQKTLPTIWGTYLKLVTKYQISAINICWEKCDEIWAYMFNVYKNQVDKQEVGIWWVQKRFPRYGVPIWSLWPNIRFMSSIVAEKNVTKNVHICSMCIKTN